jgi:hypothetical protein
LKIVRLATRHGALAHADESCNPFRSINNGNIRVGRNAAKLGCCISCMKGEKPIYRPQRFAVFGFQAIPCQIRDGNHQKVVLFAKADQVRHTRHGAVLVDDLADDASRIEAREPGKIDRSLGLAAALENAADRRTKIGEMSSIVPAASSRNKNKDEFGAKIRGDNLAVDVSAKRERHCTSIRFPGHAPSDGLVAQIDPVGSHGE